MARPTGPLLPVQEVSGAVDDLVFQTAVVPWLVVSSEGMHPVGPETESPAALTHSAL